MKRNEKSMVLNSAISTLLSFQWLPSHLQQSNSQILKFKNSTPTKWKQTKHKATSTNCRLLLQKGVARYLILTPATPPPPKKKESVPASAEKKYLACDSNIRKRYVGSLELFPPRNSSARFWKPTSSSILYTKSWKIQQFSKFHKFLECSESILIQHDVFSMHRRMLINAVAVKK